MESSLNILAIIGFNGSIIDGLVLHPDNEHLIYPLGTQIIIRNVLTREQRFLKVKQIIIFRAITTKFQSSASQTAANT